MDFITFRILLKTLIMKVRLTLLLFCLLGIGLLARSQDKKHIAKPKIENGPDTIPITVKSHKKSHHKPPPPPPPAIISKHKPMPPAKMIKDAPKPPLPPPVPNKPSKSTPVRPEMPISELPKNHQSYKLEEIQE